MVIISNKPNTQRATTYLETPYPKRSRETYFFMLCSLFV